MKTFHNKKEVKQKYMARLKQHYKADEIVHGTYWQDGKGGAVGCTIHSSKHGTYESELGIPTWLAYLEDRIFEGLPNGEAKEFPLDFLKAIPIGISDKALEVVKLKFLAY